MMLRAWWVGLVLSAVGCGGEVTQDPVARGSDPSPPPAGAPTREPASPPPSTDPMPPPSAPDPFTGPPPQKVGAPPGGSMPFHLVVTNRSKAAGAMKMDLTIDGTPVVAGAFAPNQTFTFDFTVDPGMHEVAARAEYAELVTEQRFGLDAPSERWGVLDATTVRCDPCAPAILSWQVKTSSP